MGGRGARSGSEKGRGGDAGVNPSDIVGTRDLIGLRGAMQTEVDETLTVFRDVMDEYGYQINDIELATMKGRDASVLAYYDGSNIAVNQSYFNKAKMDKAYAECAKSGFHPSSGKKSGLEAVVAHDLDTA